VKTLGLIRGALALALIFSFFTVITGCASTLSGTNQSLSVSTTGCPGAMCQLKNSKGVWYVPSTPGSITVHRAYGDMTVDCKKEGFPDATAKISSSTKVATGANVLWGVFLPVGVGVDAATGAAYDYPAEIVVNMECLTNLTESSNSAKHE